MNKQQLRKQYLSQRIGLSDDKYAVLNEQLLEQFKTLRLDGLEYIHIFLPMVSKKEPDTMKLIYWIKSVHPKIQLAYPKTDFADLTINSYLDDNDLNLEVTPQGITEPLNGNQIDSSKVDMVIVPLLVFDRKGYRVGYGKGFYDRFMARCKPGARFVGLSFFDPVGAIDDTDQYDIKLTECITPSKIWQFS